MPSPFQRSFDFRGQGASLSPTVNIGGQTYREVDTGRASKLTPVADPVRTQQQAAVVRSLFMAEHPLAASVYGIATMLGASPETREKAMMAAATVDASLSIAPRGARRSQPARLPPPEKPWDGSIRYREANAAGQSQGVYMALGAPMLGTGGETKRRVKPPGFVSGKPPYNHDRAHLAGKQLGGHADELKKVFAATRRTNSPVMRDIENGIAQRVASGELIDYFVAPHYNPGVPAPAFVTISAWGDRQGPKAFIVENPLGRRPK